MINRIRPVITCTVKTSIHVDLKIVTLPAPPFYPQQQLFTNKLTHYPRVIGRKLRYQYANLSNFWNTRGREEHERRFPKWEGRGVGEGGAADRRFLCLLSPLLFLCFSVFVFVFLFSSQFLHVHFKQLQRTKLHLSNLLFLHLFCSVVVQTFPAVKGRQLSNKFVNLLTRSQVAF